MRRTKTVLAVVAVMAALLVALAAPALADNNRHNNNYDWSDNNRHNDWFDHRDNNDDVIFLVSDNDVDDDFDGFYPYWGWYGGCEGPVCLID